MDTLVGARPEKVADPRGVPFMRRSASLTMLTAGARSCYFQELATNHPTSLLTLKSQRTLTCSDTPHSAATDCWLASYWLHIRAQSLDERHGGLCTRSVGLSPPRTRNNPPDIAPNIVIQMWTRSGGPRAVRSDLRPC